VDEHSQVGHIVGLLGLKPVDQSIPDGEESHERFELLSIDLPR